MKTIHLFSFFALVLGGTATSQATPFGIETKITADDAAAGNEFGLSVAISGNTALVGAHRDATRAATPARRICSTSPPASSSSN